MLISTKLANPITAPRKIDRRSIIGGMVGMFVDSFDIYLPAFILPAVMSYFEPEDLPTSLKVTLGSLIFTVTLLSRPIGSIFLGHIGDKLGRKRVAILSGIGFSITTLLIALLPGYAQWGYLSIGIMIFFRFIDGMFLAGGYSGPIPLALERSPLKLRGLVAGVIGAAAPIAVVMISVIQVILTSAIPHEVYVNWGWRLAFIFGVILGLMYLAYYWKVPELHIDSDLIQKKRKPLKELFAGSNAKKLFQVFLLTSGYWFAAQMVLSFMPGLLIGALHQSPRVVSQFELIINIITAISVVIFGVISQIIGRRKFLIALGFWITILTTLCIYMTVHYAQMGASAALIYSLAGIAFVITNGPLGVVILYLNERFPVKVRSSGVGIGYQFGLILPSLYSFWLLWLSKLVPYEYTELLLIAMGGIMVILGALLGPETRDVEMLEVE